MPTRPFDAPETARILHFVESVGIPILNAPLPQATFLPGMTVRRGALVVDSDRLAWPGDLLHEAGHVAVCDPNMRAEIDQVSSDPGEEMAAIAWSYAAARAIGIDARIVFHADGYRDAGESIADAFDAGRYFGVPLLAWYGMTSERGDSGYPCMTRWLR